MGKQPANVESPAIPGGLPNATGPQPVLPSELVNEVNRFVSGWLRPVLLGLGLFFSLYAAGLWALRLDTAWLPLIRLMGITAAIFIGSRLVLIWWNIPPLFAHPAATFVVGLLLAVCWMHFYYLPGTFPTAYLLLIILGAGCLFLSRHWLLLVILLAVSGWYYFTGYSEPYWEYTCFAIAAAGVLSLLVQNLRLKQARQLAFIKLLADDRQQGFDRAMAMADHFEGIAVHEHGRILCANQALAELFGYGVAELTDRDLLDMIAPQSRHLIGESVLLGNFSAFEALGIRKDKTEFAIEMFNKTVAWMGRPVKVLTIRDITESKRITANLETERQALMHQFRRQEALAAIELAIDNPQELQGVLDRITHTAADLLSANIGAALLLWNEASDLFYIGAANLTEGTPTPIGFQNTAANSATRWIVDNQEALVVPEVGDDPFGIRQTFPGAAIQSYSGMPLLSEGRVIGILFVLDNHSRVLKKEDREFLESLARRAAIAFVKVRMYERLRSANQSLELKQAELRDSINELAKAKKDLEKANQLLEFKQSEIQTTLSEWGKAKDSAEAANRSLVYNQARLQNTIDALAAAKEATEVANRSLQEKRTHLESALAELERAKHQSEIASQAKSEFLANVSHELITPLNGVIAMIDLLLASPLTLMQRQHAETAQTSAEQLLGTIQHILEYTQIDAGNLPIVHDDIYLREFIRKTTEPYAEAARRKNLEWTWSLSPALPKVVHGPPALVQKVLMLLLDNAVKFTDHGQVRLHATMDRQDHHSVEVRFAVSDTGPGIAPEAQERLFHPFTQEDGSDTRRYGGMGLGLALGKRLVEFMGGRMGVESQPGKGSTFWIVIPLAIILSPEAV